MNRMDSSVGMPTRVWAGRLWNCGSIVVWFLVEARDFSPIHNVQTGYGAHPASYMMNTGPCFHGVRGVKLTTRLHLVPKLKVVELYLRSPLHFWGVVLIWAQLYIWKYISKSTTAVVCNLLIMRNIALCWESEHSMCFNYRNYWFKRNE
jgi:hypothetical protein